MKKLLFLLGFVTLSGSFLQAQDSSLRTLPDLPADLSPEIVSLLPDSTIFGEELYRHLADFYHKHTTEKLYLVTDKPYYSAGEKLWFKGFLLDAATLKRDLVSRYIYVELVDQQDSIHRRIKVLEDENGFQNCLELDPATPEGTYTLRAYTRWMENAGPDYFFRKLIPIGNLIDDRVVSTVTYSRDEGSDVLATLQLKNMNGDPLPAQRLTYTLYADGKSRKQVVRTDDHGQLLIRFPAPGQDNSTNRLHLDINEPGLIYETSLFLPTFSREFDVQFFPESGHLLSLGEQTVAFKAIAAGGLGIEVEGKLFDSRGQEVTSFQSVHKGMGSFSFTPKSGERYTAEVTADGKSLRKELPAVESAGALLKVERQEGALVCSVAATPTLSPSSWRLVVQSLGKILVRENVASHRAVKRIPLESLPAGLVQVALVDTVQGKVVCERLVFTRYADPVFGEIETDKANYGKREKVEGKLVVQDAQGRPVSGNFALSVTNGRLVHQNPQADNILSNLQLTSELKGYIEDPGYYFPEEPSAEIEAHLDLLLLTQGWTRYNLPDLLQGKYPKITYPVEWSQGFTGRIIGAFGKGVRNPSLNVFSLATSFVRSYELEDKKRDFRVEGLEFPDSTTFHFQATNEREWSKGVELQVDSLTAPPVKTFVPQRHFSSVVQAIPDPFLEGAKQAYYDEGGMRVIDIKGVTVMAKSPAEIRTEQQNFQGTHIERIVGPDDLKIYKGRSLADVMVRLGIHFDANSGMYEHTAYGAIRWLWVDGAVYDIGFSVSRANPYLCRMIRADEIDVVGFIPERDITSGQFGWQMAGTNIVMVKLKSGDALNLHIPDVAQRQATPLGYKKPEAFYEPKYDVPEQLKNTKPDTRSTIYWNPSLRTNAEGEAAFSFYTADPSAQYDVTLEGMTTEGLPCRATATIQRTKE